MRRPNGTDIFVVFERYSFKKILCSRYKSGNGISL